MRKIVPFLLSIMMIVTLIPVSAMAASGSSGNFYSNGYDWSYAINGSELTITNEGEADDQADSSWTSLLSSTQRNAVKEIIVLDDYDAANKLGLTAFQNATEMTYSGEIGQLNEGIFSGMKKLELISIESDYTVNIGSKSFANIGTSEGVVITTDSDFDNIEADAFSGTVAAVLYPRSWYSSDEDDGLFEDYEGDVTWFAWCPWGDPDEDFACTYVYTDVDKAYTYEDDEYWYSDGGSAYRHCKYCGEYEDEDGNPVYLGEEEIEIPYVDEIKVSDVTYNGKYQKPAVKLIDENGDVIGKDNYSVTYKSNKNVGDGIAYIEFKGDLYEGEVTMYFEIKPMPTSITKLTKAKKAFTAKWTKKSTQVTGYQIQYSTSKKFTKSTTKTATVKSYKTTSKKISKLKAKKTYYVRVRTYKTVDGYKYYSTWSKAKTVKTK